MSVFNISLGMIVKNEGRTLRRCLESVAPYVSEIVIGLAGESTDDTEAIAREFTDKVFNITWTDDFSAARNEVLQAVTGDYFLWLDGDDELVGGDQLEGLIRAHPNVDAFFMGYDYARDVNDNCVCYLVRERLVRLHDQMVNHGWQWLGKVHEVLVAQDFDPTNFLVDSVVVKHHKPPNKHEPDRNTNILYAQLAEQEPNPDPRILGYLCTEAAGRGNYREAILHGQRFVKLSGWAQEKYQMQHRIADMYRLMGDLPKSLEADFGAISIQPDWPDAYLGLAETYHLMGHSKAVVEWTKAAATKEAPQTMLIINPLDYSYSPALILAGAYVQLGDYQMGMENYAKAYQIKPDPVLAKMIMDLQKELSLHKVVDAFVTLRSQLGANDEWLKVRKLFDVVPKHIEQHPVIMGLWDRSMKQTAHIDNPQVMVDFYTSNPNWVSMPDEAISDPTWLEYPRLKFALDVARSAEAKTIVDWGCSDGFISLPLAREVGARLTGFDLDPRCVELAATRAEQHSIPARFEVGNVDDIGQWEGDKADLAIFFEIIEHVVDPARTLDRLELTAKRIAITTPYMSFDGGSLPEWDRLEPKGHLRIFDQYDLEKLFLGRGRIHQLYPHFIGPEKGWIFADYEPGIEYDKTVIIGALNAPEAWNPIDFESQGLGGSETAVLKLAEGLAAQNYKTIVYSTIDKPGYYNDVCYRPNEHFRPEIESDLFIAWRNPEFADADVNTKCLVLWFHDVDAGDRLTKERAKKFDYFVALTEWHKQHLLKTYVFLEAAKIIVIGNGVDLDRFQDKVTRNPKQVIYSSSPDRGLDVILEKIWPKVIEAVPDAELHVYYGWNTTDKYVMAFPQLAAFQAHVKALIASSTGVIFHGRVNQQQLAEAFKRSSIWLYPTYFTETYCITAVEAQLGGAIPITNHLAALAETVRSGWILDGDVNDPEVQQKYADAVITTLKTPMEDRSKTHQEVIENAPKLTWPDVAAQWCQFLEGDNLSGERPVRRGQELLPERVDQLGSGSDQSPVGVDLEPTDGLRVQRELEHSLRIGTDGC